MPDLNIKEIGFALMSFDMFGHGSEGIVSGSRVMRFHVLMKDFAKAYRVGNGLQWLEKYCMKLFLHGRPMPNLPKGVSPLIVFKPVFDTALSEYRSQVKNSREYLEGISYSGDKSFKQVANWGEYCNEAFKYYVNKA